MTASEPEKPHGPTAPFPPSEGGMRYLHAYQYVFDSPNAILNLLLTAVCNLIPLIGPIVLAGYQFEIVESLHRQPRRTYPDFDFNRFVDYLVRGVWPFLVALVVGAVLSLPVAMVFGGLFMAAMVAAPAAGGDAAGIAAGVVFIVLGLGLALVGVLIHLILVPMTLRAGLSQEFGEAFRFAEVKHFISRVWLETLLVQLFLLVTAPLLMILGLALLCVGAYAAAAWVVLARAHLMHQLYELYLARGGDPIPLKAPAAEKDPFARPIPPRRT